ncbi:carbohydrate kinase family protein [Mycoplasmatota bacterium WC44]
MKCVVIGGCNIDIFGSPLNKMIIHDSNPGSVKISVGGVGRNIAENMARLGIDVSMISAVGNDEFGKIVLDKLDSLRINRDNIFVSETHPTSTYLCVLDSDREMHVAINSMDVIECVDENLIKNSILKEDILLLDGNLSEETLDYIFDNFENKIVVDGVSSIKVVKFRKYLSKIHTLKLNELEAKALIDHSDPIEIGRRLCELGVSNVYITLGERGAYYISAQDSHGYNITIKDIKNVTGAGDAFTAGIVYCLINGIDPKETLKFSTYCAYMALQSIETINNELSLEKILELNKND